MRNPSIALAGVLGGVLLLQLCCQQAHAALGEDVASVEADRQHMKAQVRVSMAPQGYTVHEIQTPMNTLVREYVSPSGKVFAVSWRGPVLPDLQQTLGSYYQSYQAAAQAPHAGHRHLSVERADIVIHSNGHMRAFSGFAYIPALLPTNLNPSDIQ